jgi:hypothetical protein
MDSAAWTKPLSGLDALAVLELRAALVAAAIELACA